MRKRRYSVSQWQHYVAEFKAAHPNSLVDEYRAMSAGD